MDKRFIEIQHKCILLLWWFGEVRRGASRKSLQYIIIFLDNVLIVIEIDGIQSKQLVKTTIDGHIPRLKLTNNDLQLLVESGVGLENGKQFFGDEEDSCVDFFLDVDVMLADLVLEGLNTRDDVIGKRD